jgi:hypothetical protein
MLNASTAGICPFSTVKDYLDNENSYQKLLRIPNLGRKTALELDKLIKEAVKNQDIKQDIPLGPEKSISDNTDLMWKGKKLSIQVLEQNLHDLIKSRSASTRINNLFDTFFKHENFPCRTVKDILVGGEKVSTKLLRYKNFGRTTVNELKTLTEQFLDEQANNSIENIHPKGLWQVMTELLGNLKPKEYKVLSCRYGFSNSIIMTLEDIGNSLGLTRERIRQIEQKALKKLSVKKNTIQIIEAISNDQIEIFGSLSDSKGVLWKKKGMMNKLPGEYRLAIDVVFNSFSSWLKSMAVEFDKGWLRSDLYTAEFKACQNKIKDIIVGRSLPIPFEIVTEFLEDEHQYAHFCASLLNSYYFFEGIMFSSQPGRRKQRQAQLYRVLQTTLFKKLEPLVELYNDKYPSRQCSARDAQIVMADAPHLFLSLNEYGWTTLGVNISDPTNKPDDPFEPSDEDNSDITNNDEAPVNLVSAVKQLLEANGPHHFVALRDHFVESFADKYSQNSLGPVLITYPDFERLAPGVYGLKKHVHPAMISQHKELLLNYRDCALYIVSRWAGEQMLAYPWWTYEMEYAWCNWAQRHSSGPIFYSLMAISEPHNWPLNNDERLYWMEIKKTKAHYSLQFPFKYPLSDCLPSLRDLYAVMVVTHSQSSMNWVRVNRVLGRRVDNQLSATYLAALIALDALQPTDHWQLPHQAGTHLSVLIKELSLHLSKQGDVTWKSDLGQSYLLYMENKKLHYPLGWINKDDFKDLLDLLGSNKTEEIINIQNKTEKGSIDNILKLILDKKEKDDRNYKISGLIDDLITDEYAEG